MQLPQHLVLAVACGLPLLAAAADPAEHGFEPAAFDKTTTPCADLWRFVNANSIKAHPIPPDRTSWGTFTMLDERTLAAQHDIVENVAKAANTAGSIEQKIGDLWATGMDDAAVEKAGFDPIREDLKRIDGLKTPDEIANFVSDYAARGVPFLFGFAAQPDFHDSMHMIAYAGQDGLGLPERDYYFKTDAKSKEIRDAYVAHITRSLELIGAKHEDAAKQAQAIMELETKLADASLPIVELRDPNNQYHLVDFNEAGKVMPHFAWQKFFAAQNLSGEKAFSLSQPKFFAALDKLLAEIPAEQWRAYLRFHFVNATQPYLSKAFEDEHFAFYAQTLRGQKEQKARWKRVLDAVNGELGMALGQLYVAQNFSPEAKGRAQQLVDNLRTALKARIEKLDWMGADTKQRALEKWDTFSPKIGYPDKWRDWSGLTLTRTSYFDNLRAAWKFNHEWRMGKIGKPVDRSEWGITPQTVNAYYNPLKNEIVFPAAILQPPFFDAKADDAVNYGAIGAVIGHEMTHGYDDKGSQFDAKGNLQNWWTDEDRKQFTGRTDKLVKQFDDYVAIDGLHVHGKQTLGENIADLGGLNTAFDALQVALGKDPDEAKKLIDGYTQQQRFFLAFARVWDRQFRPEELKLRVNTDVHAPDQFRAIAAPSNMVTFAQAFSCKADDAMVRTPEVQVKIW